MIPAKIRGIWFDIRMDYHVRPAFDSTDMPYFLMMNQLREDIEKQKGISMKELFAKVFFAVMLFIAMTVIYLKAYEYFTGVKFSVNTETPRIEDVADKPHVAPDTMVEDMRALIMALRDANAVHQQDDLGSIAARGTAESAVATATTKLRGEPIEFTPGAGDMWYYAMVIDSRVAVYIIQKGNDVVFYLAKVVDPSQDEDDMILVDSIQDAVNNLKKLLDS